MSAAGPEPLLAQNVTAVSGFAYGVIGADIHVLPGGAPLYLLANWQPPPPGSQGRSRVMPGRVPGRRAAAPPGDDGGDLARLELWRASSARLAVRWLYGPGGDGSAGLAGRFAARSAVAGWKVISAVHGPDAQPASPGSQDAHVAGSAGLLMTVEHADRWLLANLTWLLKNALLHQPGTPARVLMTARTADAWPRIRGMLDSYQADTSSQRHPGTGPAPGAVPGRPG